MSKAAAKSRRPAPARRTQHGYSVHFVDGMSRAHVRKSTSANAAAHDAMLAAITKGQLEPKYHLPMDITVRDAESGAHRRFRCTTPPPFLMHEVNACRVCGCTDDDACEGGCSWVAEDLCSACAKPALAPRRRR